VCSTCLYPLVMPPVSATEGPVAVTGASGYIGSHIVRALLERGYEVRACVRDLHNRAKVDHLFAFKDQGYAGRLTVVRADLTESGSYDAAFAGCRAVFHAAAALGHNHESPQEVYDVSLHGTVSVLDSVKAAGTVRRVIFTSSAAAVAHPRPEGYVFTEKDWAGDNVEAYKGRWTKDRISKDAFMAYAMAKADCERVAKQIAEEDGRFDTVSVNPIHVLGPLLCANHHQSDTWQAGLGRMLEGQSTKPVRQMLWNVIDVRDIAEMQCLIAESHVCKNGARYIASAADRSGEFFTPQLQAKLAQLYPQFRLAGEACPGKRIYDSPRAYCLLAKEELGLKPHTADSTLRGTCDSLLQLGLIAPQKQSKL